MRRIVETKMVHVQRPGVDYMDVFEITTYEDDPRLVAALDHARRAHVARRTSATNAAYQLAWDELRASRRPEAA